MFSKIQPEKIFVKTICQKYFISKSLTASFVQVTNGLIHSSWDGWKPWYAFEIRSLKVHGIATNRSTSVTIWVLFVLAKFFSKSGCTICRFKNRAVTRILLVCFWLNRICTKNCNFIYQLCPRDEAVWTFFSERHQAVSLESSAGAEIWKTHGKCLRCDTARR